MDQNYAVAKELYCEHMHPAEIRIIMEASSVPKSMSAGRNADYLVNSEEYFHVLYTILGGLRIEHI